MERIGVRELRQNASKYLARVEKGETLEITDRGRPVALLAPVPQDEWEQMIADGRVIPAERRGDLLDIEPVEAPGPSSAEILDALREDRL